MSESEQSSLKRRRRMLWTVLRVVIIAYVCLTLLMWAFQSRLVYFPSREIYATPDAEGMDYEAVVFEASDGVKLSGWFVPAEKPRGVVLFCHGNAGNISHRLDTMRFHRGLCLSSFHFDYRGYGQSEGRPSEKGTYLDVEAAWRYLTDERKIPADQVVLHGRSLGAAVAAWLATERTPKALIIESSFTSMPDLGAGLYPFLPVRLISRFRYDTKAYLGQVSCPVLVVHSPQDEIIPFGHGRRLFEAAKEPKSFLEIAGSHNEGWVLSEKRYREGMNEFISRHLSE
jgi:fermentation-respiration switch protein FrsA (DUF1100 family)